MLVSSLSAQFAEPTCVIHTLNGQSLGDQFGWVSAPLPDLNGDGAAELVVTAPFRSNSAGRVYVYSGRDGRFLFLKNGRSPGSVLGHSARPAGDLDGDGKHDVIAGAPGSPGVAGYALLMSGADGSVLGTVQQGGGADQFGFAVAGVGDVDGDGTPDVAVSAIGDDEAGTNAGAVYVLSGGGGSVLTKLLGLAAGDGMGSALGNVGDVTGDGVAELVVGASSAGPSGGGMAYVFDLTAPSTPLHTLTPDATAVNFGHFFADSPGDVNLDGWPDVYVSDFSDTGGGPAAGKAYVFDGRTGARIWTIPGTVPGAGFGIGRGAGDVDGDGYPDLLLCGWQDSTAAPSAGKGWLFSGRDLTVLRTYTSTIAGTTLGFDAHGMGDVDGDGRLDFVLTGAQAGYNRGVVYLVSGCDGSVQSYGSGLAGTGGQVPALSLAGCPAPGSTPVLQIDQGLGGATGALLLAASSASVPFAGGQLLVGLPVLAVPRPLSGAMGAPGAGAAALPLPIPDRATLRGTATYVQAAVLDQGAAQGIALSDGLTLSIK
ncbi:MAG: FG-GAP-like repeat-containing protein [Planctomycetota bacterium]